MIYTALPWLEAHEFKSIIKNEKYLFYLPFTEKRQNSVEFCRFSVMFALTGKWCSLRQWCSLREWCFAYRRNGQTLHHCDHREQHHYAKHNIIAACRNITIVTRVQIHNEKRKLKNTHKMEFERFFSKIPTKNSLNHTCFQCLSWFLFNFISCVFVLR